MLERLHCGLWVVGSRLRERVYVANDDLLMVDVSGCGFPAAAISTTVAGSCVHVANGSGCG